MKTCTRPRRCAPQENGRAPEVGLELGLGDSRYHCMRSPVRPGANELVLSRPAAAGPSRVCGRLGDRGDLSRGLARCSAGC